MASGIAAFGARADAEAARDELGGEILGYGELLAEARTD
jgi:hypothetical protein